jgi:GTPase SAR1 family protein
VTSAEITMRYAQLVIGPAGSGKSTYCSTLASHAETVGRRVDVVNLDPAAEHFTYQPLFDVRDLIAVEDVMEDEEIKLGPNGGLVFCWEYLMDNTDWLEEQINSGTEDGVEIDDDYILFDCPGQIELYTHMKVVRRFVDLLQSWNFRVCAVFLIDSHFMVDGAKFLSGAMAALSAMVNLEIPHVNVLSKIDLLGKEARKQLDVYLEPDTLALTSISHSTDQGNNGSVFDQKYAALSESIGRVLDDYSLVKFIPLDISNEENISDLFLTIDNTIQYGEDADVKIRDDFDAPQDEEDKGFDPNSYFN